MSEVKINKCINYYMGKGKTKEEAENICYAIGKKKGWCQDSGRMEKFSNHNWIKHEDGTYSILNVPIFELGEHKGFPYTSEWADETLNNFQALKTKKRLPRMIIGHTSERSEKKAVGFLDNLKKVGELIYADFIRIKEKVFNGIKNMEWPGRSVEVNPHKKKITALALLGGSEPYFDNLEPIEIKFKADPDGVWINFEENTIQQTIKKRADNQEQDRKMGDIWWIGKDLMDDISHNIDLTSDRKKEKAMILLSEMLSLLKTEGEKYIKTFDNKTDKGVFTMKTFTEDEHKAILEAEKAKMSEQLTKQFKEKHGVTPDEAMQKFTELQAKRIEDQKKAHKEKIDRFCEDMKKQGLAPALVDAYSKIRAIITDDKPIAKFDENGSDLTIGDYLDEFMKSVFKYAKDGKLVIPEKELAPQSFDEGDKSKETERVKFYEKNKTQFEKMGVSKEDFLKYGE